MAQVAPIQQSFNAGELSQRLQARSDLNKYPNAIAGGDNMFGSVQGDLKGRSGTRFVAEVKDSSKKTRLVRFEFSTTQAYILEFGDLYVRFYKDNGRIEIASVPVEIVTPYLEADLFDLKFKQSADVMYITHPEYVVQRITRTSDTTWFIAIVDFIDGPYFRTNRTTTTLDPSGVSGSVTVVASSVVGINLGLGFLATDVGRTIRFRDSTGAWTWMEITARASTTSVTALIKGAALTDHVAGIGWRMGLWSETTKYPATAEFFEERLWMSGGGERTLQRVSGSRTSDFHNFSPTDRDGTVVNDHSINYSLTADNVNAIHWMANDEKGLILGTAGGEWLLRASSLQEAVTPGNVQAKRASNYGSANIAAIRAGRAMLFLQRSRRKLRQLKFEFELDGFEALDMTLFSDNITKTGVVEMAYQQSPQPIIWATRVDGILLSFIYQNAQQVFGWFKHTIGGSFGTGDAVVESVSAIPAPNEDRDEVWLIVKRTINGGTKRYVEFITPEFDENTTQEDGFFVDSGLTYDGVPATIMTGLGHLEGETVSILSDGAVNPPQVVASAQITLDRSGSKVHIGLGYNMDYESLRFEAGSDDGTSQGKQQRINRVTFKVLRTLGGSVGPSFDKLDPIYYRSSADLMGSPPALFTGNLIQEWDSDYDDDARVVLRQSQPLPFWLLAVMPQMTTYNP